MKSPSIAVLPDATVHKIAAGEVIERPANAVKELVENALDAGARKITILLEDGGKELVRVIDDGSGMTREELQLAWLPHSTSKIRDEDDLFRIHSYGFRGEALSSVGAVAEMTLETRHADEVTGSSLTVVDSVAGQVSEISRTRGTTVTVKNLFAHNPVRRKFMGTGKSETLKILNTVTRVAFAHPGASFRVSEKGRDLLRFTEGTLRHRTGEVLGFNVTNDLVPVDWSDGRIHIEGFISTLQQARSKHSHQYLYVNLRSVQSPLISRAWAQGYDVLPPGRFPMGVLFLTFPPDEVDVNVHPTKKEVRFLKDNQIFWAVSQAVRQALRKTVEAPALRLDDKRAFSGEGEGDPAREPDERAPAFTFVAGGSPERDGPARDGADRHEVNFLFSAEPAGTGAPARTLSLNEKPGGYPFRPSDSVPRGAEWGAFSAVPFLQVHNGFICFAVQSGLMLVNQQAAHERVIYEKSLEGLRKPGHFASQQLLFPEVLEFTPDESRFLEENLQHFQSLAFDLESFGGNTFQLRGLPMEINPTRANKVIQAMVTELMADRRGGGAEEGWLGRMAQAYARMAGVKLGDVMDHAQITSLIDSLFATQNPYVSPSGATIVLRYTLEEILRRFGIREFRG